MVNPTSPSENNQDRLWQVTRYGVAIFSFSPFLGGLGLLWVAIAIWHRHWRSLLAARVTQGFAVVAVLQILSTIFADQSLPSFWGLFNFLPFFFLFPALAKILHTPHRLRRIAQIVLVAAIPVALIGWGQMLWGWHGHWELTMLANIPIEKGGNPPGRMSSIFIYANFLASYLLVPFALGLGLWLESFWQVRANKAGAWWQLTWQTAALTVIAIALFFTHSRNAWGVAGLMVLVFAIYASWYWMVGAIVAAMGVVLGAAFAPAPANTWLRGVVPAYIWQRLNDRLYADRPVELMRTTQWQFAGDMISDRWWLGWGLRSFSRLYEQKMQVWLGHPHNLPLMLAAETGIPAALLFLTVVGWILARGVLSLAKGMAKPNFYYPGDRLMLFSYLVAFGGCTCFHLLDVPLFDVQINMWGWLSLAGIWGLVAPNGGTTQRA